MQSPSRPKSRLTYLLPAMCLSVLMTAAEPTSAPNPLLTESSLPYHLPPFDLIKDDDYAPAFELGMTAQLQDTFGKVIEHQAKRK